MAQVGLIKLIGTPTGPTPLTSPSHKPSTEADTGPIKMAAKTCQGDKQQGHKTLPDQSRSPLEINDDEVQFVFSMPRRRKKKRKR